MAGRDELSEHRWSLIKDIASPPQAMDRPRRDDRQVLNGIVPAANDNWPDSAPHEGIALDSTLPLTEQEALQDCKERELGQHVDHDGAWISGSPGYTAIVAASIKGALRAVMVMVSGACSG